MKNFELKRNGEIIPIHFDTISSTNRWVKEHAHELDLRRITRVTASKQTEGRGRYERPWLSPKDQNIYVTYFFRPKISINLAQVLSISIANLIAQYVLSPRIKWPNDLLIDGKKIAGVLAETAGGGIALGAGININMPKAELDKIDQSATSFFHETGELFYLDEFLTTLDDLFLRDLTLYETEGFAPFYPHYDCLLAYKGQPIRITDQDQTLSGILHSLSPDGRLNILLPSGEIQRVASGEITPIVHRVDP